MSDEPIKTEELPKTTSNVVEALGIGVDEAEKIDQKKIDNMVVNPKKEEKKEMGRPTVITELVLHKLEEVFALDGTDEEACFYAGIAPRTLYNYQKENPEFVQRKEALKEKPILLARRTAVENLNTLAGAHWYLERKRKKEFSVRVEQTGADGKDLHPLTAEQQSKLDALLFKKEIPAE